MRIIVFGRTSTTHGHARTLNDDEVYLKLTVVDDVLIVSFKEL